MQKLNWNYYVSVTLTHSARLFLSCNILGVMSLGLCERDCMLPLQLITMVGPTCGRLMLCSHTQYCTLYI